ncbi:MULTISPECIES: PAS domain-containing sensor histidine kinase [Halorubrum]|uniref:Signal-transducing histidine kinase n=1 Tax=Halorubrum hochstenium ATCC 700873 TaxID=1227481 RepID=M0FPW7_9EURY|nr:MULTISPECIES: PAS domain S-box protein [Halorubrum]ELZ60629.1 signal-transducing histidine kinase [Halorubrum hochstenium ATCC 700873]
MNDHFCRQFDISDRSAVTGEGLEAVADEIESSFDGPGQIGSRMTTLTEQSTPTHRERLEVPDGRVFELSYLPMNDSGEATMWLYEDVTGEFERRRQLKQYETAVNAFGDPVYVLDDDGRFEFANEALAELTGWDPAALEGRHVSTIMGEEDVKRGKSVIRSLLKSDAEDKNTFEMEVIAADGSTVLCENHVGLIRAGDLLEGTVGALRDISDRKRREEEIKRERDRLAATFDAAPSPFVQARSDDRGLVIERVNNAFIEVFGYDETELIGATLGDRIVPEGVAAGDATSDPHTQEVVRETADGEQRTFLVGSALAADTEDGTEVIRTYTDITDHKRRVRRLEQIRQNVSDVIWISDPDKDEMEFVSDSYESVWGRSPESLKREPASFIRGIHGDDRDRVTSALEEQSEHPDEYEETYRVVGPDGDIRWVRDRSSGIYQDGELERIIGVASDITDRKRQQQELERERALTEQALDTLEDIFYVVGADGTFLRWNERLPEVTGHADEVVDSLAVTDVIAESDREPIKAAFDEVQDAGRTKLEATVVTSDGERIPYEFRASRFTRPDGTDSGVVGIGRDISEQKRRERELQTFERAVEDAGHAIFWMSDEGTIEYANSAFAQQTGYDRDEAVGSTLEELWPEQSAAIHDEMWDTVQSGDTWESEFVIRRKDGRRYTVQLSVSPVYGREGGSPTRYVGVASDITERYRREQRLSVLQRVLRHDLRNNLNEALLAAQLIDRQSDEPEVETQVEAIYQVVEETLALSKKVRKSQKLFEEGEDYNTVIDVADRARSQVASLRTERSEVTFAVNLPAAQHAVTSDLVDQALRNVIQNAIERLC